MELARYSIDVRTAMDDLYIGPQADVLERLERINREYVNHDSLKLGITPKFRWKPGTYDKVKEILTQEWLQWHRRPSGMNSLFSRERSYAKNRLKESLIEIENILSNFRAENRTFITDPDEIRGHFELFKSTLLAQQENLRTYFPNSVISIVDRDEFSSAMIETVIPIENIKIDVTVGNRTGETRELGLVDYGDVKLRFQMPLCKWFNIVYNYCNIEENTLNSSRIRVDNNLLTHHGSYGNRWNQKNFTCIAEVYPKYIGAKHPYVSQNSYGTGNVCMGEMMKDIIKSYLIMDWNSMGYWIDLWMTTYKCGVTGPLNNINMALVGKPVILDKEGKDNSDSFYEVVGTPSSGACWDRSFSTLRNEVNSDIVKLDEGESVTGIIVEQCNNLNCTLREKCKGFLNNTKGIEIKLELEQFQDLNCKYEILLPNQQEEEQDVYYYSDIIREALYPNNLYDIQVPYEILQESFRNKAGEIGLRMLNHMIQRELIYCEDSDEHSLLFIDAILNAKNNDMIWQEINNFFPREPRQPLSDEQEEMAAWAHAVRQQ
tara:strand:+ start:3075 stop:4712 length:1638 start_codon:yes stop_codon:yes gene_type:complete